MYGEIKAGRARRKAASAAIEMQARAGLAEKAGAGQAAAAVAELDAASGAAAAAATEAAAGRSGSAAVGGTPMEQYEELKRRLKALGAAEDQLGRMVEELTTLNRASSTPPHVEGGGSQQLCPLC